MWCCHCLNPYLWCCVSTPCSTGAYLCVCSPAVDRAAPHAYRLLALLMEEMGLAAPLPCPGLVGRAWQQVPAVAFPRLAMSCQVSCCCGSAAKGLSNTPHLIQAQGALGVSLGLWHHCGWGDRTFNTFCVFQILMLVSGGELALCCDPDSVVGF